MLSKSQHRRRNWKKGSHLSSWSHLSWSPRFREDLGIRSLNMAHELWENSWEKIRVVVFWREINVTPTFNRGAWTPWTSRWWVIIDPKRFCIKLLKELVCDYMDEEGMVSLCSSRSYLRSVSILLFTLWYTDRLRRWVCCWNLGYQLNTRPIIP